MSLGRLTIRRSSLLLIMGTAILMLSGPVAGDNRAAPAAVTPSQTSDVAADVQKLVEADWIDSDRRFGVKDAAAPAAAKTRDDGRGCGGRLRWSQERLVGVSRRQRRDGPVVASGPGQRVSPGPRGGLQPLRLARGPHGESADSRHLRRVCGGKRAVHPSLSARRQAVRRRSGSTAGGAVRRPRSQGPRGAAADSRTLLVCPGRSGSLRGRQPGGERGVEQASQPDQRQRLLAARNHERRGVPASGIQSVGDSRRGPSGRSRQRILAGPHANGDRAGPAVGGAAEAESGPAAAAAAGGGAGTNCRPSGGTQQRRPKCRRQLAANCTSRPAASNGRSRSAIRCWRTSTSCCSSSGTIPRASSTCATSSTAATPSPAGACSCWTIRSGTSRS